MDLKIDRENFGDMVFVNGECPVTEDFADSVAQKVYIMLRTFEDEWYLNQTTGVPYLTRILGKKVDKATVDRILQENILAEPGVADILSFESTIDSIRKYEASFTVRVTDGTSFSETLEVG